MVSSVGRNWVGGLASGLDTDSLIKQIIESESARKLSFEQKRNTVKLKQEMLQDINLKLYNLQNAASDLTFNAAFNSKNVSSTDSKLVNAVATTAARVGEHTIQVKQIATATSVASKSNVATQIDPDAKLKEQHLSIPLTGGRFALDGVLIEINPAEDSLNDVLNRITDKTNLEASYNPDTDKISLRRKDGTSAPIGVGSNADTSNFLKAAGLINGTSKASARLVSKSLDLGENGLDTSLNEMGIRSDGYINVTVNNRLTSIDYSKNDSLQSIIDRIKNVSGIEDVYYDADEHKLNVISSDKGAEASIKIEDGEGKLARTTLGFRQQANGRDTSDTLTAERAISSIDTAAALQNAGFAEAITTGTFSINGVEFKIASTAKTTLDSLIKAINDNEDVGVKASYNASAGKLELTSLSTGNQSIALGADGDTSNFLDVIGLKDAVQNIGQNAIYTIDGSNDIVSQSNDVSDAIEGVTFKLRDVTTGIGETITIETDTEGAKERINKFIDLYNEVTELIYSKLTEKRNNKLQALTDDEMRALGKEDLETYQKGFSEGLLKGESTLRNIRSQMRTIMSSLVPEADNTLNTLADIGITTGAIGSDYRDTMVGTLKITDEKALDEALRDNPDKVAQIFGSNNGIASRLKKTLNEFTRHDGTLTSLAGKSGSKIANEMTRQITELNRQISEQELKLAKREDKLVQQFASLETAMSQYQAQSAALSNQLLSLQSS